MDEPDSQDTGFSEETFQTHFAECEDCRKLIEGIQADAKMLNAWSGREVIEPGVDFTQSVLIKLGLQNAPSGPGNLSGRDLNDDELEWVAAAGEKLQAADPPVPGVPRKT
ncbi:hypothetical protein RP726_14085 [Candidatus Methylospira mobilis]|nr:hypothetical protein [Candidatus Methylospira mobilis]WNV03570.1 hypothetical protein RP726_14085 [Candidatus Methylospira mobilis]